MLSSDVWHWASLSCSLMAPRPWWQPWSACVGISEGRKSVWSSMGLGLFIAPLSSSTCDPLRLVGLDGLVVVWERSEFAMAATISIYVSWRVLNRVSSQFKRVRWSRSSVFWVGVQISVYLTSNAIFWLKGRLVSHFVDNRSRRDQLTGGLVILGLPR